VSVLHFAIGLLLLCVGGFMAVRREAVVARAQRRSGGRPVQGPTAFLVVGVLLALVGISQLVQAFV
jgi:uncharacterized membrane protein HdeD (DUF308 family)